MSKPLIITITLLALAIIGTIIYSSDGPTASLVTFEPDVTPTPTYVLAPNTLHDSPSVEEIQAPDVLINDTIEPLPPIGLPSKTKLNLEQ